MRYRKPALYAGIGMIIGAASVASLSFLVPNSPPVTHTAHLADTASQDKGWSDKAEPAESPMVVSPRSGRQGNNRPPMHPDVALASTGPMPDTTPIDPAPTGPRKETLTVARGDTLIGVLVEAGIDRQEAHQAIESMRHVYDPRDLRPGVEVTLTFQGGESPVFQGFSLSPDPTREVATARDEQGGFSASEVKAKLNTEVRRIEGTIDYSLFDSATQAGMPLAVLTEMIRLFSYDVDFQRDIQQGDGFAVMYDHTATQDGETVGTGEIAYASLTLSGQVMRLYRYQDAAGTVDYYNEKGQSVRKALLKTPINGARLSSGFGMRRHPILGYSKMHKGIDFAAPTGTPIYAAGDGVVEMASPFSGYGNYVRIRHTKEWATAYGHMSGYGRGIRPGAKVRQGDIIGYVGSTGQATGPHLHYEIMRGVAQVNPVGVKFPTGRTLDGKDLKQFASLRGQVDQRFAGLGNAAKVASSQ